MRCFGTTVLPSPLLQVRLLDSVDACLVHPNEDIQQSAALALSALLAQYFPVGSKGPSARLQGRVVDKYVAAVRTEDNPAATRGFALGLGHLPAKLLAPTGAVLDAVLGCLSDAFRRDSVVGGEGDAETRRNAIVAVTRVCNTVGIDKGTSFPPTASPLCRMTKAQITTVFASLLASMDDYNRDRRGDVGSWSRIAAMEGLEALTYLSIKASTTFPHSSPLSASGAPTSTRQLLSPTYEERCSFFSKDATAKAEMPLLEEEEYAVRGSFFDETLCRTILSALLKQLGEKLDAVRCKAGECLERLLINKSPRLPFVPHRRVLVQALGLDERGKNWSDPALTFPLLMKAVNIADFTEPILAGLVVSVGGLTESVAKSSSAALFDWIKGLQAAKATLKIRQIGAGELQKFESFFTNVHLFCASSLIKLTTHLSQSFSSYSINIREMDVFSFLSFPLWINCSLTGILMN